MHTALLMKALDPHYVASALELRDFDLDRWQLVKSAAPEARRVRFKCPSPRYSGVPLGGYERETLN